MNKRIIKKITTISVLSLLAVSCGDYKYRSLSEDLKAVGNPLKTASSDSMTKQMDKNDLNGCPILIEQSEWHLTKYGIEKAKNVEYIWDKNQTWKLPNGWESSRRIDLDFTSERKSYVVQKSKTSKLVYVGKWKYVEKIGKNIRLIAEQEDSPKEKSGGISNYYESMDEQNKKIPEMPLKLVKPTYGDELCILKWHNKYGYNAIAESYLQLRPGFWNWLFRNHELVITGKIIEANE